MRSKVAVIVSLLFVLGIGAAALAVNTRILETSPQPDVGRANDVFAPTSAPIVAPIPATGGPAVAPPAVAPPPAVPAFTPPAVPTAPPRTGSPPRRDDDGFREDRDDDPSRDDRDESEGPEHDSDD